MASTAITVTSKDMIQPGWLASIVAMFSFAVLTALAAQVRIPVPGTDVPMTLQLLVVLLAGLMLSAKLAAGSMGIYLLFGVAGLPVFAPGSTGLMGGTAGYLVGFVLAAGVVSMLRGSSNAGALRLLTAALTGTAIVLACGLSWRLMFFTAGIDAGVLLSTSLVPFVPKAVLEALLAVSIVLTGRSMFPLVFSMGSHRETSAQS